MTKLDTKQIYWMTELGERELPYCPVSEDFDMHYPFEAGGTTFSLRNSVISGLEILEIR